MTDNRYYGRLRRNILAIILVVSMVPLFLIAAITGYQFHTAYRHKVLDYLMELVDRHAQTIDTFLVERLANIQVLAAAYPVKKLQDQAFLATLLHMLQEKHQGVFVDLGLVDQTGFQVAYAGPFQLSHAHYRDASWFRKALAQPYTITDVFLGLRGLPHFIVAVQLRQGSDIWVLRSTIDFMAFNQLVEKLKTGETGFAFILNRRGEFQTQPDSQLPLSPQELLESLEDPKRQAMPPLATDTPAVVNRSGRRFAVRVSRIGVAWAERKLPGTGRTLLIFSRPLKEGQWFLFYLQDEQDAFSDLYRTRRISLGILIFSGLAIFGTGWWLSRRIVDQIIQVDREKEMMNEQVIEAGKLASIGELAAGIAHEINNPVAIMVEEAGWVQDLLEDLKRGEDLDAEEIGKSLDQIRTQGVRCKEITHKLLSFARRTDPTVQQVQINELIQEVVGLVEQRARYAGIRVRTHLSEGLPRVAMSPTEMQQVLLNLINNALDAMEKSGGELDITTRYEDGRVIVDVADTGEGIPPANLKRIFDPFFTTKAVGKGTGLGLSICYGIIKKMGGEVSVNSAVGVGTTFHIFLPAGDGGPQQHKDEKCERNKSDEKENI